ncbi:MAG: DUF4157 domain-containing protein [Kofleriaceae bacterium]
MRAGNVAESDRREPSSEPATPTQAAGKLTRAEAGAAPTSTGATETAAPGHGGTARAADWGMTSELSSALGIGPSPGAQPAVQRKLAPSPSASAMPSWAVVQRRSDGGAAPSDPAQVTALAEGGLGGGGGALPHRESLESGFGVDLGGVRAHTDGAAAQACTAMGAEAFAYGDNVAFASASPSRELVAHEVAHVIQQRSGAGPSSGVGQAGDSFEVEADHAAATVASGGRSQLADRYGGSSGGGAVQRKVVQKFEENEHKQMGDEGSGNAKIKLSPDLEVSFGDITAMAGDYFESAAQIKALAAKKGDGKNVPGTADEIIFVLRVHVQHRHSEEESFGADLRKAVKERFYRMASFNPTHFTNVDVGDEKLTHEQRAAKRGADGKPVNNAGSYRENHIAAIKAAAIAGKAGGPRDEAMLSESFASHYLTDAYSSGHVRTNRSAIESWWNARVPMFWTNIHWWMAEQIAKHINANNWRGNLATVDYMWQEARGTIKQQLQDKGIPNMTFGNVISGAVHDVDNADGVMVTIGDEVVKLFGDGKVLDANGKVQAAGVETGKKAAAGVKASVKDIDDAYAKGKAGMEPDAVVEALKLADGLFRAEQLWPKALPDGAAGQGASPKWQQPTVDALLAEPTMKKALQRFANNKADTLGAEMKLEEEYKNDALQTGVLARLRGDENKVIATFREIIDYVPDTGGHGGYPILQSPIDNNSDDNAMEYYQEAKAQKALSTLTTEQRYKAIRFLIAGSCGDDEEQAIIEMLDTAAVSDMVSIVTRLGSGDVKKGIDYLDSGIDGAEWDELCNRVLSKSPTTSVHMDDNGVRAAVAAGKHTTASAASKRDWIKQLLDGVCGDDDEAAIIRILQASTPGDVTTIVNGVGYGRLWDKVDGAESMQLTKLLKAKGYFGTMPQATKLSWVKRMSDGRTNDNAQELIVSILESASPSDAKAIIDSVGDGGLNWDLTGSHQDRYDAVKKATGPVDDDAAREAIKDGKHANTSVASRQDWIKRLMDGVCGDDDEAAIIRVLRDSTPSDVVAIVDGVGYGKIWDKVDGAESMQLTKVLAGKGYFGTMSQATKISWVKRMSDGRTNDNAQELIVSILESSNAADVKAIIDHVGNRSLNWDLTGSHQDRYDAVKKTHGL